MKKLPGSQSRLYCPEVSSRLYEGKEGCYEEGGCVSMTTSCTIGIGFIISALTGSSFGTFFANCSTFLFVRAAEDEDNNNLNNLCQTNTVIMCHHGFI